MENIPDENNIPEPEDFGVGTGEDESSLGDVHLIDFEELLKADDLEELAFKMTEEILQQEDFMKKDILDRFLDFVFFKVQTGDVLIPNMAYPTKEMIDKVLEKKIVDLINIHLFPEIIYRILKFFTRNMYDADSNLYIANLIHADNIILSIFETFKMIRKDIFISDPEKRTLNVKRIQQFSARSENKFSSPLDTAARLKYILEFIAINNNVQHIYSKEDLLLSKILIDEKAG